MAGVFCTRDFTEATAGEPRAVFERVRRLVPEGNIYFLTQVHADHIVVAEEVMPEDMPEADGIISKNPEDILSILTADCLPILAWSDQPPLIAAIHAGWRGLSQRIIGKGMGMLQSLGASHIHVSIGPAIGPCCYAVKGDVTEALHNPPVRQADGRHYLDLWDTALRQLMESGIQRHLIQCLRICTACHRELFFSYRRDGEVTGRNISAIGGKACLLPGLRAG